MAEKFPHKNALKHYFRHSQPHTQGEVSFGICTPASRMFSQI